MTDLTTTPVPRKNAIARAVGVVFSPRETYADVAAYPTVLVALLIVLTVMLGAQAIFTATDLGRDLMIEEGVRMIERFGLQVTDQMYAQIERQASQTWIRSVVGGAVFLTMFAAILAGVLFAIFNAIMGGNARFKQVFSIVVHSGYLLALQTLFIYPMFYAKQSMSSPTSLAVFLPGLDPETFVGRIVGGIDFFRLWWIVNLSIGVGVLYKRKSSPIITSMLIVYALIVLAVAAISAAFSGA
ncbi:MAG TPA: YIP1 family protein [Vicinamibacterales bacterium]|jgi:hypothetical protein|nr:YIP1 family protein [Vicinamibacterales bacterium]